MEGEAHRDCTERPAWREGPVPVDYADPPDLLPSRTIDELLGPQADYRKTQGAWRGFETARYAIEDVPRLLAAGRRYKAPLRWWQRLFRKLQGATDVEA